MRYSRLTNEINRKYGRKSGHIFMIVLEYF